MLPIHHFDKLKDQFLPRYMLTRNNSLQYLRIVISEALKERPNSEALKILP